MKKQVAAILIMAFTMMGFAGDKPAYMLFEKDGRKVKYEKMIKTLEKADIVFFGELHTDPIAHWLQIEMTKELFERKKEALILGAEMFEADNQLILDEYLKGMYGTDKFEAEMRLWGNYQTDYKPLVEFAKEKGIPFIATNIPRRYASMVYRKGFEALEELSEEARSYMAPLPMRYDPEVKCYKEMLSLPGMGKPTHGKEMEAPGKESPGPGKPTGKPEGKVTMPGKTMPGGTGVSHGHGKPGAGPSMANLPKAQAAKDATMAHFILTNWSEGKTLFHFNGSYHSNNFEGIVWHLRQQDPGLKIMTINLVQQKKIGKVEEGNLKTADYIICVPESMTRTSR